MNLTELLLVSAKKVVGGKVKNRKERCDDVSRKLQAIKLKTKYLDNFW